MTDLKIALLLISLSIFYFGCKRENNLAQENKLIASVGSHELYLRDLSERTDLVSEEGKDSISTLYSRAEYWTREIVFLDNAKNVIKNTSEIDKLVESYRNSLLIDQFERLILKEKTDTIVTDEELMKYYNERRGEYKLDGAILKMMYVIIKKSNIDEKFFKPLWMNLRPNQIGVLQKYCSDHAEDYRLNGDKWQKWNDIKEVFPSNIIQLNKLFKGMQQLFKDKDLFYYIKVIDLVKPNEEPPLSFVKEQAINSILYIKKNKILENRKKQLYEDAVKAKKVNIFVK